MPRLILYLFGDPRGGRRDLVVDLRPEADTTAFEHEQDHRRLVDRLLHGGTFRAAAEDRVVVERFEDQSPVLLSGG